MAQVLGETPSTQNEQDVLGRKEVVPIPTTYIAQVNFDGSAILPPTIEESKSKVILLFGYDTRGDKQPAVLAPFPLGKTDEHEKLNDYITGLLKPEFAKLFERPEEDLRFPSLYDLGPYLSPYMRHETGYAFLMLSEEKGGEAGSPKKLREALRNTGNIFLMSVGVRWHMNSMEEIELTEVYRDYFEQLWGSAPQKVHRDIEGTNLQLKAMEQRGKVDVKMSQDWPDIADMGHGPEYMMMRTAKKGGTFEIVAVGGGIPPNYGTPIGASYLALRFS